ncbi:MAG TPA: magnesium/cobalt transporter CorA [Luteibaculaceae bacterium]|nr:magnesium/cobalt transporter CorA [Luteibaculaceae bacterium]
MNATKSIKRGLAPGALVFVGERKTHQPVLDLMVYDEVGSVATCSKNLKDIVQNLDPQKHAWINVSGIHDTELIESIGQQFGIHNLVLEDILNTDQRPKVEDHGDYYFITIKMLWNEGEGSPIVQEQFSLCRFDKLVISFQEQRGDLFDPIRRRFSNTKSRLRTEGSDYLTYVLLDAIIDNYIFISDEINAQLKDIDKQLFESRSAAKDKLLFRQITRLKYSINNLREITRPAVDLMLKMNKSTIDLSNKNTIYFKDLQDLTQHAADQIETLRENLNDLVVIYQTNVANRLNEIMKLLTVFNAVFIPLTFMTGVYGTNFEFIPETKARWGFYYFLASLVVIAAITLYYFRRKRWL